MKRKVRGKVIMGIAMTVIVLATLMAPTGSTKDITSDYLTYRNGYQVNPGFVAIKITEGDTDAIKIGQEIIFSGTKDGCIVLIQGIPDTNTDGEAFSASAFVTETVTNVSGTGTTKIVKGRYFDTTSMSRTGTYIISCGALSQYLLVSKLAIPLDLKVGSDVVSSIAAGTPLRIDSPIYLDPNDCVDLKIVDPTGRKIEILTLDKKTQYFDDINVSQLIEYGSTDTAKQIDTTGWIPGTYTFSVITAEENSRGLGMSSISKSLEVLKGEVDIDVDKTEFADFADFAELQPITVTLTGIYGHLVTVEAIAGRDDHVEFEDGLDDFVDTFDREYTNVSDPVTGEPKERCYGFNVTIKEVGKMQFSVIFHNSGAYTLQATDLNTGYEDTVDVNVSEKEVTFDMPANVVVGEDLEIRGTANAGDYVDIAIEDYIVYTGIPIEEDGTFEADLRTPETRGTGTPGTIAIEAFIRVAGEATPALYTDSSNIEEDGSISVLLTSGSLSADISAESVAHEDEFTVEGTAEGSDFVDIVTIAPKGGSGRGINPGSVPAVPGITHDCSAVSGIDYSYLKELYVDEDADTGKYAVVEVSPGRNGVYDEINDDHLFGAEFEAAYGPLEDIGSKTRDQILAIIQDATIDAAGSDDLMVVGYIKVETPMVSLNPITGVDAGEPLVVTGTSNREDGYTIIVTVTGEAELPPATVPVENGTFKAILDTTGAEEGTYTVEADDGKGHTDEVDVDIGPAKPTPP